MVEPQTGPAGRRRLIVIAAIVLVAAAAHASTLRNGFVYDDNAIVVANPLVRSLDSIPRIFATGYWGAENADAGLYRPLVIAGFAVDHALWGYRPVWFHLVNVLLHVAVCLLAYAFLLGLLRREIVASVAALVFAAHPVHVEAVSGIVGRAEILSAGLMLAALLFHFGHLARPRRSLAIAAGAAYLLAMLAKETAVVLPLLAVALEGSARAARAGPAGRPAPRLAVPVYLAYGVALAATVALRTAVIGAHQAGGPAAVSVMDNPLYGLPAAQRSASALYVLGRYLMLLAWPLRLSADYSYDQITAITRVTDPRLLVAAAVVFVGIRLVMRSYGRHTALFAGLAFIVVPLIPVSNLVVPIGTILAERLLYLPVLGFGILLAVAFERARRRPGPIVAGALLTAVLVGYGVRTVLRNRDWRDDATLFAAALEVVPRSSRMHLFYGRHLGQQGRHEEAIEHLDRSLEILPGNPDAISELGYARMEGGEFAEAERRFREAVRIDPDAVGGHYGLGRLCLQEGRLDEARDAFRRCVEISPLHIDARVQIGLAHYAAGNAEAARVAFATVLSLDPTNVTAEYYLGMLEIESGERDAARRRFERVAAAARPWDIEGHVYLARIHDGLGRTEAAYASLAAAVGLNPLSASTRAALAEHLLGRGAYREAVEESGEALKRNPYAVDALQVLGAAELALGHAARAESALVAARALRVTDPVTALNLARVYLAVGDEARAERELRRAWLLRPESAEVFLARAALERARGSTRAARELLYGALERHADSVLVGLDLTRLDVLEGDRAAAIARLDALSQRRGLGPRHRCDLASLQLSLGLIEEADASLAAALAEQPRNAECLYRRAEFLIGAARSDEAERVLHQLLDLYEGHAEGMNALAWLLLGRDASDRAAAAEALAWVDRALAIDPGRAAYHDTRAGALERLGRPAEALAARRAAAGLEPGNEAYARRLREASP